MVESRLVLAQPAFKKVLVGCAQELRLDYPPREVTSREQSKVFTN